VRDTYLVFEVAAGLAIVDQHALHERVLLEQLKERIAAGALEVQRLLVPAIVEFPATDADLVLAESEALAKLGLSVERFGGTSIAVHSIPALLAHRGPAHILGGIVERLREGRPAGGKAVLFDALLHSMACRSAVMAGDRLDEAQIAELMRRADLVDTRQGCAHGRPTALHVSFRDLERHFRR
jgi:DNA mismatch repair protein MutL